MAREDDYAQLLQSKRLWPVDPSIEQDWSGRGQHVKFERHQRKIVDEILQVQDTLGTTTDAIVQSVKCRRILLARKTVVTSRRFTKAQAIEEVAHLSRLDHSHIVRVIGTYKLGRELSILLYPVAEYNLATYMDTILSPPSTDVDTWTNMIISLTRFFSCLSHAVRYIHNNLTKHMDIKPQNILVRNVSHLYRDPILGYKVYIADFGISRSYQNFDATETEGPTSFTRKYAAPEVVDWGPRGLSSDIFSLGCVYAEMIAVLGDVGSKKLGSVVNMAYYHTQLENRLAQNTQLAHLHRLIESDGVSSFQGNIDKVHSWLKSFQGIKLMDDHGTIYLQPNAVDIVLQMIRYEPHIRPQAYEVSGRLGVYCCCDRGAEPLEATKLLEREDDEESCC